MPLTCGAIVTAFLVPFPAPTEMSSRYSGAPRTGWPTTVSGRETAVRQLRSRGIMFTRPQTQVSLRAAARILTASHDRPAEVAQRSPQTNGPCQ